MKKHNLAKFKVPFQQKAVLILSGLFLSLVLLEVGLRAGGLTLSFLQEYRNRMSIKQKGEYRIMCIGESTTAIGGEHSYPSQLEEILNQKDIGIKFSVINKGVIGIRTTAIVNQLENNLDVYKPDIVIAMMGINDVGSHMLYEDMSSVPRIRTFLKHFKVYKFARLLKLHIMAKIREIVPEKQKEDVIDAELFSKTTFVKQRDGVQAQERFEKIIESDANNSQAYIDLGWFYKDSGEYSKAEDLFKKAIKLNPESYRGYFELAFFYKSRNRNGDAEKFFKKAIELNPRDEWGYIGLGEIYRLQVKPQAEEMLGKALQLNPLSYRAHINLGWFYKTQKKYHKAEEMFKKAIELNPKKADEGYKDLGWFYKEARQYLEAEKAFKKAVELNPANEWPYIGLGRLYKSKGDLHQAKIMFKKAIELNSQNYQIYIDLAEVFQQQGRYAESEVMYKKAITIVPYNEWCYIELGNFYESQGMYSKSEEMFKKAIELNQNNEWAYFGLGRAFCSHSKFRESEEAFEKALELNPENDQVYYSLSIVYKLQNRYLQAEEAYKKAIALNPDSNFYIELAFLYKDQAKYAQAQTAFENAIEQDPEYPGSYIVSKALAEVYKAQGKNLESQGVSKRYKKAKPDEAAPEDLKTLYKRYDKQKLSTYQMDKLQFEFFVDSVIYNYRRLKRILGKRGVKFVCMQYPERSIGSLKKIFQDQEGITFISNEKVFKEALKRSQHDEYFTDMFARDFGHCTPKGNRLIADNVANVILKEVFNIQ